MMAMTGFIYYICRLLFALMLISMSLSCVTSCTADDIEKLKCRVCGCDDAEICKPIIEENQIIEDYSVPVTHDKQVFVISEGNKNWNHWLWAAITAVISMETKDEPLMCHAHLLNKRYGIIANASDPKLLDLSSTEADTWMTDVKYRTYHNFADIVLLDAFDLMSESVIDDDPTPLVNFINMTRNMVKAINKYAKIVCLVPWKPPCFKQNCDFVPSVKNICDSFMLNPESYVTLHDTVCKARATIPYSKLILGADEYLSSGLTSQDLIAGFSWHGYEYTCTKMENDVCFLPHINETSTICDYARRRVSTGEIIKKWNSKMFHHKWHFPSMSPYFNIKVNDTGASSQVWFEDMQSLQLKYNLIYNMDFLGISVWTGDDLAFTNEDESYSRAMWIWILHSVLHTGTVYVPHNNTFPELGGQMAGISVGCLLLGLLIGSLATYTVIRKRQRKRHAPFHKDDYEDEDITL